MSTLFSLLDTIDDTPAAQRLRARTYELLGAAPATTVVDVGCGTGRAVAELNDLGATAIGVDIDDQAVQEARRRYPTLDIRTGNAYELPLDDAQAHGYRADKLFHDLADPAQALAEARRILAPAGRLVLIGQDWDTFIIESTDPDLTRTIVHARADTIRTPRAARRYRNLLLDTGFHDVEVEIHTSIFTDTTILPMLQGLARAAATTNAITPAQAEHWTTDQNHRAATDRLFVAIPLFIASASKPA